MSYAVIRRPGGVSDVVVPPQALDLSARDRNVLTFVARFRQLSARQLHQLLFTDTTMTPTYRSLNRLVAGQYLMRLEHRIVGGSQGGSGQYVYQLGRRGFYALQEGRHAPWRAISFHTLAVADSYIALRELERAGSIQLVGYSTEPDSWVAIDRFELKPDLYVELRRQQGDQVGKLLKLWLEVDMGTENQVRLREKMERYWLAYNEADNERWPEFPTVLFVACDAERERELRWLITQVPADYQPMFRVTTVAGLTELLA